MAKLLKLRGGTTSQHSSFTGAIREVTVDTDKDTLIVHDGSTQGGFPLLRNTVEDTTPQLGGNLDVNGNDIVSTSNANIDIVPNGTGDVTLQADQVQIGSTNENATITTSGTGDLTINTNAGTNSGSVVIADGANGNISVTPNGTGSVVIDGLSHPQADGSANQFLKTDGSGTLGFATVNTDLSNDSTPQLGGNLDVVTHSVVSTSNRNIAITPNGSGKVVLDGISYPTADGSATQFIQTDGSGVLSFADPDLSLDATPQLGGDLDVVTHSIVSTSNRNITVSPNGSGKVVLDGLTYPASDGSNGQFLKTDGSGALSFATVDLSTKADINSQTFTGTPAAPTAAANTNTTQIATTAFVQTEIGHIVVLETDSGNADPVAGDFTNGAIFVGQY